ncbi:universal stress protein [Gaiella sp.]|uniref:universal stress protein n=1 Tax=Gaiella sp. TaxID=2663207 RepID=UPI002C844412|nr:universal stress protein [Gaiella sp.]HWO79778.1 universal stress protein [Gaiella sp.]
MPGSRRRREVRMERVLGTPALFATAYGNVGSSIYYALGLTAVFALGLTPLVFVVAGIVFAATAATYAEGTVRFPEAGGSSSFARHAFDELISFGAAWAQMLVYIVTIATSAFFVPHYLSIFWEPLKSNPWDIVGGAVVVVLLVTLNIVGVTEAAKLSIGLAVIDFATQVLLVLLGFALVFSPETLVDNVHWGTAPTWENLAIAIPVAMLAYTGVETVSNLAEEAREPQESVPNAYKLVALAVFAIYFTLPLIALSALPVKLIDGELTTLLALPPEDGGYANDPILGVVDNLGLSGGLLDTLELYVGVLAATILLIATNAGIIGASRITYSMATYRQLPEVFRKLHPKLKTPYIALVLFAGIAPIILLLPGDVTFVGTLYSLGATLSFTVAHAAMVQLRVRPDPAVTYRARPNVSIAGVQWPLFAIFGGLATGASFVVILAQNPLTRWVGLGWIVLGFVGYTVYRLRWVRAGLRETVKAPPAFGAALALAYRRIVVPIVPGRPSDDALDVACRLAAERGARVVALTVIEVPLELPLDADLPEEERLANDELDEAMAVGDTYGVRVVGRLVRGRSASVEIVREAERRGAEIIVLGSPRKDLTRRRGVFGSTVDRVMRRAPCRVMVTASRQRSAA